MSKEKSVEEMLNTLAIKRVKARLMEENQANYTYGSPFIYTDEQAELKVINEMGEEVERTKEDISNVTMVEVLINNLRDYKDQVDKLDETKDNEIYLISGRLKEEAQNEEKEKIIEKYNDKKLKLKEPVKQVIENVGDYLQEEIGKASLVGDATSTEAINDLRLLDMLPTIEREELEIIVNRYKGQPMILRAFTEIGKKHNLIIIDDKENDVDTYPQIVKEKCTEFIDLYGVGDNSYTSQMLITESKGNWLLAMVGSINDYLLSDIKVSA